MASEHVKKLQLSGSLRDIGCPEARLAMLIPRTMLNMVILFLLLLLRLQLVSEHPSSPSVIYSPAYLQTFFELLIFLQIISSELRENMRAAPYLVYREIGLSEIAGSFSKLWPGSLQKKGTT